MLREISEEVRINLKDRLRDVRHAIRQHRHDGGRSNAVPPAAGNSPVPFPLRELEGLLGHAVSAFDDVMTAAETLVPHEGRAAAQPRSFETYFPLRGKQKALAGERAFRRDMYYLVKAMLARKNASADRVHEASFAAVHAAMLKRYPDLIAALGNAAGETDRTAQVTQMCAALVLEFLHQRPLRLDIVEGAAKNLIEAESALIVSLLAPAALACGLASMGTADEPDCDPLEIAALAVEARLDRIISACRATDPVAELTPIFAMLLFHLR
ncbi:hypothetical protein ASD64_09965 [Mesorhizobium sp. Root157]|uniref:hypothetical protein n=1 Tax=Mesorhizobium sp. Root157 TaxID=1736477 RepID=UPI0006F1D261|nr:hypothetical protein [Mesorhizobium sp. Root157]KQZ81320.1 hypothetical protein ASD64_09965 [Mesorhizobium sp. Root157]